MYKTKAGEIIVGSNGKSNRIVIYNQFGMGKQYSIKCKVSYERGDETARECWETVGYYDTIGEALCDLPKYGDVEIYR